MFALPDHQNAVVPMVAVEGITQLPALGFVGLNVGV
tara:strand:+ start:69 stop:176 length:108 start_codon:yes stop_codon:yes gene_type:complete